MPSKRKAKKARKVIATIMPIGGPPFEVLVMVAENNTVEHNNMAWVIAPNSTWRDDRNNQRVVLPEATATSANGDNAQPQTVDEQLKREELIDHKHAKTPDPEAPTKKPQLAPWRYGTSVSGSMLRGKISFGAAMFFLYIKMNIVEQLFRLQSRRPWYKDSGSWMTMIAVACVALVLIWFTVSNSNSIDHLAGVVEGLHLENTQPPGATAGHQPIAPGG